MRSFHTLKHLHQTFSREGSHDFLDTTFPKTAPYTRDVFPVILTWAFDVVLEVCFVLFCFVLFCFVVQLM